MRDIPMFTTHNGVASLYLSKIPFSKEAYVQIRDSVTCEALLKECVDVCRTAGAEKIFASGHNDLSRYPLYCCVNSYSVKRDHLPSTQAIALPVTLEQRDWWRKLYNQKMTSVATAAPLSLSDTEKLICDHKAFYICSECAVLGIGVAYQDRICAVASILPGGGTDVVVALANCLESPRISLSVASTNDKAIKLYKSLGFAENGVEACWYQIF